jgi:ATP-dependent Clp protease ATP-binding subunit ClpX
LSQEEKGLIKAYVESNLQNLADKYNLTLTPARIDIIAAFYSKHPTDMGKVIKRIKTFYDEIKTIELYFLKDHDINIVLEDDAIDFILAQFVNLSIDFNQVYKQLATNFELGLKLVREKTGRKRFFLNRDALMSPESYISSLLKSGLSSLEEK